jgi:hypothetical protein
MGALAYTLVFGVFLGLLATDAKTPWLMVVGWVMASWMFLAAIITGIRMHGDDD